MNVAGTVSLTCNRTLIASTIDSIVFPSSWSHPYPRYHPLSWCQPGRSGSVTTPWLWCVISPDPEASLPPAGGGRPVSAPAEPRGSAGHAWSAGFDWAAVVVVTGRRRRSGQTVPGTARSPLPPWPLLPPVSPTRRNRVPTVPAMACAPVRTGLGVSSPELVPRAAGPGRGRARTRREVEAGVRSRVLDRGLSASQPGCPRLTLCCWGVGSAQPWPGSQALLPASRSSGPSPCSRPMAPRILGGFP